MNVLCEKWKDKVICLGNMVLLQVSWQHAVKLLWFVYLWRNLSESQCCYSFPPTMLDLLRLREWNAVSSDVDNEVRVSIVWKLCPLEFCYLNKELLWKGKRAEYHPQTISLYMLKLQEAGVRSETVFRLVMVGVGWVLLRSWGTKLITITQLYISSHNIHCKPKVREGNLFTIFWNENHWIGL